MEQRPIHHICNLAISQPKLWEKLVLFFLPMEVIDGPAATVWYKVFWDRLYIYQVKNHTTDGKQKAGHSLEWRSEHAMAKLKRFSIIYEEITSHEVVVKAKDKKTALAKVKSVLGEDLEITDSWEVTR